MLVETRRIVPITRLQRELTKTVRDISETGEAVYILKNNTMEAVIVPFEEYEHLTALDEMFEYFEIDIIIQKRLVDYDIQNNISWTKIREE
ncbi:MAG: type II toxin-antitoxin system Phd/YefM family antitoxin [Synergistaceae bacterium]|nr:type II toxin-antitoxin system Phd/YefM family antitoxin [Synergistaceae bacterium]